MRFPIRFDPAFRQLSRMLFLAPGDAYLEIAGDQVHARFAWSFRASFPRSAVRAANVSSRAPLSRGVHGFGGRWLVNGAGDRILEIGLDPPQRAFVLGVPVKLRELLVSVDDPLTLAAALLAR